MDTVAGDPDRGSRRPLRPTGAERRLSLVVRVLAFLLFVAGLIVALGPIDDFFRHPPLVAVSAAAAWALGLICLYAGGDVRRRADLVPVVILALAASAASVASMLAFAETGTAAQIWFVDTTVTAVLWAILAAEGLIAVVVGVVALPLLGGDRSAVGVEPATPDALSPAERAVRGLLGVLAIVFAAGAIAFGLGPHIDTTEALAAELPFVAGSVLAAAALALASVYAAVNLRRNLAVAGPVIAVLALAAVVQAAYLLAVDTDYAVPAFGGELEMTAALWIGLAATLVPAAALLVAYRAAWRARYGLGFLWPGAYRALLAVAEVVVAGPRERVSPEAIGARVEAFLDEFRASRRWLYRVALLAIQVAPLIELRPRPMINPPLSELDPASRRRFLVDHYQRLPRQPQLRMIKNLKQVTIRICQQLSYAGYYGDPATFESVGYQPFTQRPRYQELQPPEPGPHPLEVEHPGDVDDELETEICIVGSGAAGSILAYELAKRGREVVVLERGHYVEPRHFTEDEIGMISKLYSDGLMQQTEDWRFTILQGSCVGGSTTVNNAVCFPPPEAVLARWNDPDLHDAGLDLARLEQSVAAVEQFLSVTPQTDTPLNPSGTMFVDGAGAIAAAADDLEVDVVRANLQGCLGSGYCNIGCKWGRKLSMLDTALPWAQRDFPGKLRIIADCRVERILTGGGEPKQVTGVRANVDGRRLKVRAKRYVISAGAVGSSYLLIQSGIGRGIPVGKGFSSNMGAPLTAEFDRPVRAYDGLQISHYGIPKADGFVFETWFNPPVSQALNMPGWFETHFERMERYPNLMAVGVLVGTASNGTVRRALTGGPGVVFSPEPDDLATLARGLKLLGRILFEAGARRVMVNTWGEDMFTSPDQLEALDQICADPDYIALGTGHPQGGNALSRDPERGVVGPDFRVHGHSNLYVCDASVFPTSLTVNPQLTVMALAHYAAEGISEGTSAAGN